MALQKHAAAKVIAAAASIASLLGLWVVVRSDPPSATDAATIAPAAPAAAPRRTTQTQRAPAKTQQQVQPRRHTRTRAS